MCPWYQSKLVHYLVDMGSSWHPVTPLEHQDPLLTLLVSKLKYSAKNRSIPWLLMSRIARPSAAMVLNMQYKQVLFFHEDKFQLPGYIAYWILRNKLHWNLNHNAIVLINGNESEYNVCKMYINIFQPQCFKLNCMRVGSHGWSKICINHPTSSYLTHSDRLVEERHNSTANALELYLSGTNSSIYAWMIGLYCQNM